MNIDGIPDPRYSLAEPARRQGSPMMRSCLAFASSSALAVAAWLAGCSSASHPTSTADNVDQPTDAGTVPPGCPSNTGYPGDDMCLAAPPPDQGFQLHYGATSYG